MSIIQIPTTNFWANRHGFKPKWLILHGTAGGSSAQGIAQQFIASQGTADPKSVHYVVDQKGVVVQCVQEKDAAWGNGIPERGCDPWWNNGVNPNLVTISIEHVKSDTQNASALTDAQKLASFALIRDICERNNIPMRKADKNGGITGHFSISPTDRAHCPGTFPWQELFTLLQGEAMLNITDPFAAAFFKQIAPDRWQCNNGFSVIGGILKFYRQVNGAPRLPKANEQYNVPGIVWQPFEAGIAVYDPEGKLYKYGGPFSPTYLLPLDSDLAKTILGIKALEDKLTQAGSSADVDALKSQVQSLQSQLTQAQAKEQEAEARAADLQNQLAARPDKSQIASELAQAIQAALAKI